jgi:uncharacterized protein (TIGR00156 family)
MRHIPFMSRKRRLVQALCLALCLLASGAAAAGPGPATGGYGQTGGYTGPGPELMSVQQALSAPHDTSVSLKGNITRWLGRDEYAFTDSTGSAEIKIPPHAWMGQHIAASDTVELQGEVRKDRMRARIHTHRIVKR